MSPSTQNTRAAAAGRHGRFTAPLAKPPLHPFEQALLIVTIVHVCFLPWALGTMHLWSQVVSLGVATFGFALSMMPRHWPAEFARLAPVEVRPAERLWRFPVFWAGAALLVYVAIQGFNPAWRFRSNETIWWLEPLRHVAWLPSGIVAPMAGSNPWRALIIYSSLWLTVCSFWVGVLRRKSYRILFLALASNTVLLALLGVLQLASRTRSIFWSYLPSNDGFVSSFIYPNHGGAYFNLMLALVTGLGWWHWRQTPRDARSGRLLWLLATAGIGAATTVVLSYSRMSTALLAIFLGLAGVAAMIELRRGEQRARHRGSFTPVWLAAVVVVGVGLISLSTKRGQDRFWPVLIHPTAITDDRAVARAATRDLIAARWLFGWGAGSFRHAFPLYARRYPDLTYTSDGDRQIWEHAHDDLLEFPAELGVVGLLGPVFSLGYLAWRLARLRFWRNPLSLALVAGCALTLIHAWVDFVFQNPAVLITWAVMLIGAIRWIELDRAAPRRVPER